MIAPPNAVELRNIAKSFGGVAANTGINLNIQPGTIHAIVGENGAGKSTAMKILYGMVQPDSGAILLNGVERQWRSPLDAIRAGIGMVHQHFMLADPLTAFDNIVVGAENLGRPQRFGLGMLLPIEQSRAREKIDKIGENYGLRVPLDTRVSELSIGLRQRLEIVKLLYRDANILILDEPTAVLTPLETQDLFNNLRRLKGEGKTIVIITHKLREVLENTEHVTVFRSGRTVGTLPTKTATTETLATLMVGHKIDVGISVSPGRPQPDPVLDVRNLSVTSRRDPNAKPKLRDLNLQVCSGEIVGIAGVHGNGQTELLHALLGLTSAGYASSGQMRVLGAEVSRCSTAAIKARGVAFIPEDRQKEGLLMQDNVVENLLLGFQSQKPFCRSSGLINWHYLRTQASIMVEDFDVRPRQLDLPLAAFSGGNQQKVVIAREFAMSKLCGGAAEHLPKLIIAAEPTRGVDVGAIAAIHKRLVEARDAGAAILLVSSDLEEVLRLSDRVHIMYEGTVVHTFARGECAEQTIGMYMGGATGQSHENQGHLH